MVSLERVVCGQKNFDMVIVFKDLKRNVFRLKSIPTTSLERIKGWLDSIYIKHYQSRINLRWRPILKTFMVEPHMFIEDGEWDFLNMDRSDSDSEKSDKDYEPSDVEAESEPDDGDSNSESLASESSVESEDDEEDSEEDLEEEEMTWSEWEEATNADREVGSKSNSEGKRRRMETKALGKSRGVTSSSSSPKRAKLRQKHGTEGRIKQLTCTLYSYAYERRQDKVFTSMLLSRCRCSSSTTAQPVSPRPSMKPCENKATLLKSRKRLVRMSRLRSTSQPPFYPLQLRQNHALKLNSAGNEPCRAHPTSFLQKSTQRSIALSLPLPFVGNIVLYAGNTLPPYTVYLAPVLGTRLVD
ncbi:hypothetical protein Ancab_039384 [Ancistrocladus abbreviatus]